MPSLVKQKNLTEPPKGHHQKRRLIVVRGIAYKKDNGEVIVTPREAEVDVNQSPFPSKTPVGQ